MGSNVVLHLLYRLLLKNYIPRIANTKIKNIIIETKYPMEGRDMRRVVTNLFIEGTALIVLRGLKTLKTLIAFKLGTFGRS